MDAQFDDLTQDGFLGGRLQAWQPRRGFRSGIDAVLLAAAVPARAGQSVLELGCGAAVASLCLGLRVPGLDLSGVELQPAYAALAARNAQGAGQTLTLYRADLRQLPPELKARRFDHVMMNPPYFDRSHGSAAVEAGRDLARGGDTAMGEWVGAASRRLRPGGWLTVIQRAERLPELMQAVEPRLGAIELLPLLPRADQPARLILLRARKERKSPFILRAPLILHHGLRHGAAGGGYAPQIEAVLRGGQALGGFED